MKRKSAEIKRIAREKSYRTLWIANGSHGSIAVNRNFADHVLFLEFDSVFRKNGVGNLIM